ncbi:MAG: CpsB/CapC family capsule biosynthesis tyrosine phosphatase [Bryobacteraceae bacterium]
MIDIHSHILWDIDDGARTFDDSLAMIRLAAETGTTDIVATPHANSRFAFRPEVVEEKLTKLRVSAAGLIGIHSGCDFHLSYDNIQDALANPAKYTIAHRSYLLVEFSEMFVTSQIDAVFERMLGAGIVPVITHPERNATLQQRLEELSRWVEAGCLLQVTAQSLLGRFGSKSQRFAEVLLKKNLVHVIASDAHDLTNRPPRLDLAYTYIAENYSAELARRLFVENPEKVLNGTAM